MQMRDWFKSNATFATLILVISLAHIDGIALLSARCLFGTKSALFNAPLRESTRSQLEWFGIVGNLLEDIPQLALQLLVRFDVFLFFLCLILQCCLFILGIVCCQTLLAHERPHD